MTGMGDQAGYWRQSAEAYALVIGVAAQRGTSPLLIAMMRETETRYRSWADRIEAEDRAGDPWQPQPVLPLSARLLTAFKALC